MRTLLIILAIATCSPGSTYAQRNIDSIIVEITHLPTTVYTSFVMDSGGGTDDLYVSVRNILKAETIVADSMAGDTLIVFSSSGSQFKLVFNSDTTLLSGSISLENLQISLIDAPLSSTSSTFTVQLDTPEITTAKISYYRYSSVKSGGATFTETEVSSGPSSRTSIRVIFYTASTSTVDKQIKPTTLIFPNPARDMLSVVLPQDRKAVARIYDLLGREVLSASLDNTTHIDVSNLQPGMYMLMVGTAMQKIVIE